MNYAASILAVGSSQQMIKNTIEILDANIETEAEAVASSSEAVEVMVSNIRNANTVIESNLKSLEQLNAQAGKGKTVIAETAALSKSVDESSEILLKNELDYSKYRRTNELACDECCYRSRLPMQEKAGKVLQSPLMKFVNWRRNRIHTGSTLRKSCGNWKTKLNATMLPPSPPQINLIAFLLLSKTQKSRST